jgi:hypothetical protein
LSDNPHDAIFKYTFSMPEHAAAQLKHVLPTEFSSRIDWATLTLESGSYVDEELKECESDLLYSAQLAGTHAYVYLLFEHQSSCDALMPLRLLSYVIAILKRHVQVAKPALPLPIVIPMVLHHSEAGWNARTELLPLFGDIPAEHPIIAQYLPQLRFCLDDISHASDELLRKRALEAFPMLVLWALRDARTPGQILRSLRDWADKFLQLLQAEHGVDALRAWLRYISDVVETSTPEDLQVAIAEAIPRVETDAMTISEMLRARGEATGISKGKAQLLASQMRAKFGEPNEQLLERLRTASSDQLDIWGQRLLFADSIDAVFAEELHPTS